MTLLMHRIVKGVVVVEVHERVCEIRQRVLDGRIPVLSVMQTGDGKFVDIDTRGVVKTELLPTLYYAESQSFSPPPPPFPLNRIVQEGDLPK